MCQTITLLLDCSEFLHEFHYVRFDQLRYCIQTCFLVSCSARVQVSHYRVKLSRNKISSFNTNIPQLIYTLSLTHVTPLNAAARENTVFHNKRKQNDYMYYKLKPTCGDISEFSCVSAHLATQVSQHRQIIASLVL